MLSAMYIPLNPPKSPGSQMLVCKIPPILQLKKPRLVRVKNLPGVIALAGGQAQLLWVCLMPEPTCVSISAGPHAGTVLDSGEPVTMKTQGDEYWNLRFQCSEVRLTAEQTLTVPSKPPRLPDSEDPPHPRAESTVFCLGRMHEGQSCFWNGGGHSFLSRLPTCCQ